MCMFTICIEGSENVESSAYNCLIKQISCLKQPSNTRQSAHVYYIGIPSYLMPTIATEQEHINAVSMETEISYTVML